MRIDTVFVDMDNTIADFAGSLLHEYGTNHDRSDRTEIEDLTTWNAFCDLWDLTEDEVLEIYNNRPFFLGLDQTKWASELIDEIGERFPDADIVYCTTSPPAKHVITAKIEWLEKHGFLEPGEHQTRFISTACKHRFARPNAILIDDADHNITSFDMAGGQVCTVPRPWNKGRAMWEDPMVHIRHQLDYLEHAEPVRPSKHKREQSQPEPSPVALRDNSHKLDLAQTDLFDLDWLAVHMTAGRDKYPDDPDTGRPNWMKGGKPDAEYIGSMRRHLAELTRGDFYDDESETAHAAAIAWNALALLTLNHKGRPRKVSILSEVTA